MSTRGRSEIQGKGLLSAAATCIGERLTLLIVSPIYLVYRIYRRCSNMHLKMRSGGVATERACAEKA